MYTDIIWDFDGTLFNSYNSITRSFQLALQEINITEDFEEINMRMKESVSNTVRYYKKIFGFDDSVILSFANYYEKVDKLSVDLFPYAIEICQKIYKSNKRNYLYTHRDDSALEYLKIHKMDKLFVEMITENNGFLRKPNPEAIFYLIDKHKICKEKVIMIGDRDIDCLAAKNAGINSCLFSPDSYGYSNNANYTIRSLEELNEILRV